MDVDTAFLYAPLEESIYITPPVGMKGDDLTTIENIKPTLKKTFQMKDLGEMKNYLGMRITRSADSLVVDQTQYATDVVKRFSR